MGDENKRDINDKYGEEGLRGGGNGFDASEMGGGAGANGYQFQGDPMRMFPQFFGGSDPFSMIVKDPAVQHELSVSLEDIYKGCTKKMQVTRKVMSADGQSTRTEDKYLTFKVQPGCKSGTTITFPKEGDQHPGRVPADIVFVIKDKPHPTFRREGCDIRFMHKISLNEALCGVSLQVPTLDGTTMPYTVTDVIRPSTTRRITGQGLPVSEHPNFRGDLIIEFDVKFPAKLSEEQKMQVKKFLPYV